VFLFLAIFFLGMFLASIYKNANGQQYNYEVICLNGVQYYDFMSGITVRFNPDGTVAKCE